MGEWVRRGGAFRCDYYSRTALSHSGADERKSRADEDETGRGVSERGLLLWKRFEAAVGRASC